MTKETGLLRDLNLKPGDVVKGDVTDTEYKCCMNESGELCIAPIYDMRDMMPLYESRGNYTVSHRAPRTIGTLKEIGAKVGDVVKREMFTDGGRFLVSVAELENCTANDYRIISRATPTSPVRTVTKKEIVPGVYGIVEIEADRGDGRVDIIVNACASSDELTAAIKTLTEIREAM